MKLENHQNVFILPSDGGYMVYAPLAGRIIYVNTSCARQLQEYFKTGDSRCLDTNVISSIGGLEWLNTSQAPVPLPLDRHFHPSNVILFLTNRCNLRCSYCYAEAGAFKPVVMAESVYRTAIDFVFKNARRAGSPVSIGFHGGGEPTIAWDTLVAAMSYVKSLCKTKEDRPIHFGIATNGVMSEEQAEFIATEFPVVTLSFDGPADIQNKQRPMATGGGSYDAVMSFIEILRKHGTKCVIRSTITGLNVELMPEMVNFFADHTDSELLHFEPAFLSGRCHLMESGVPPRKDFSEKFIQALDQAYERGIVLRFSPARLMGTFLSYCGCSQDGFNITPEGYVTACFEVCQHSDPLADIFHYGHYDNQLRKFRFDIQRLKRLRSMNIYGRPFCKKCFAKWNCAGDCPAKINRPDSSPNQQTDRCEMIQTITKAMLERSLRYENGLTRQ